MCVVTCFNFVMRKLNLRGVGVTSSKLSLPNILPAEASLLLLMLPEFFSASIIAFLQGGLRFPAFQPCLLSQPSRGSKSMGHLNGLAENGKRFGGFYGALAVNLR